MSSFLWFWNRETPNASSVSVSKEKEEHKYDKASVNEDVILVPKTDLLGTTKDLDNTFNVLVHDSFSRLADYLSTVANLQINRASPNSIRFAHRGNRDCVMLTSVPT